MLTVNVGRTKTTTAEDRAHVVLTGRSVVALKRWIEEARIESGPLFRGIDQWGYINRRALTPKSINLILKTRCSQAGLDPEMFFGAWAAVRLSDRGGEPRRFLAGGDAAVVA